MKFIALKDFSNNFNLEVQNAIHPRHIHKGYQFEIGTGEDLKKLQPEEKLLVAQLTVSGCVGLASDKKLVARVHDEIEQDRKREANARNINMQAAAGAAAYQLQVALEAVAKYGSEAEAAAILRKPDVLPGRPFPQEARKDRV